MLTSTESISDQELDAELVDVLIAISVIARRLAKMLQEKGDGQNERTGCTD